MAANIRAGEIGAPSPAVKTPGTAQRGFTYLGLLYVIAVAGIAFAGTGILWSLERQREREQELLFIGAQYRQALVAYGKIAAGSGEGGTPDYPERLEQLLEDTRQFPPVRHLRRLYRDPMCDCSDWTLVRREGRIVGIASRIDGKPIKIAGFAAGDEEFAGAASYRDWRFIADAGAATTGNGTPAANGAGSTNGANAANGTAGANGAAHAPMLFKGSR